MNRQKQELQWSELLNQAVSEPGVLSSCYSAFHSYSLGNQIAAWFQCQQRGIPIGPLATFPGWKERGRHVKRGEKALLLCMPVTMKRTTRDDSGEEIGHTFKRFVWRANWFTVHQTEGEAYVGPEARAGWDKTTALEQLNVAEEAFGIADGNCQGYAKARTVAVSPVAVLPHKTLFHELAHVVLGHTSEGTLSDVSSRSEYSPLVGIENSPPAT